tara:strand:- start:289 stop:603 length:315 start_codon:yes stop_codon:yes gene_type:complete
VEIEDAITIQHTEYVLKLETKTLHSLSLLDNQIGAVQLATTEEDMAMMKDVQWINQRGAYVNGLRLVGLQVKVATTALKSIAQAPTYAKRRKDYSFRTMITMSI